MYRVDALYGSVTFPVDSLFDEVPLTDGIVRLSYRQNDVFDEWCMQQIPTGDLGSNENAICLPRLAGVEGGYGFGASAGDDPHCTLGDGSIENTAAPGVAIDCNQAYLCGISQPSICTCGGDQCYANGSTTPGLILRRSGDELVGVFSEATFYAESGQLTSLGSVRFRRAD